MQSSNTVRFATLFGFGLLTATAAGCSSNPSVQEVLDKSVPVICDKTKECAGTSFDVAYPGGTSDCIAKTKAETSKKYGNDLEKSSVCTDDELDKCLQTFKTTACPSTGLPAVPCNC